MKYANLHLHSIYSDGIYTPAQLCELALQKGYGAIALTDHNTVRGVPVMEQAAAQAGLEFLTGIETCADGLADFHIVGLDFDPTHPRMQAYTAHQEDIAIATTKRRLQYCLEQGYFHHISWKDVEQRFADVGWFCNEQVFALLQEREGIKGLDYWTFMKQFNHAPVLAESIYLDYREIISIIRDAGGVAVLAHPHRQLVYLPELVKAGLNGVETCHPDIDEQDEKEVLAYAEANHLYISGGTDHSGLLGNCMKRGRINDAGEWHAEPDVSHGADKAAFEALKHRIYG